MSCDMLTQPYRLQNLARVPMLTAMPSRRPTRRPLSAGSLALAHVIHEERQRRGLRQEDVEEQTATAGYPIGQDRLSRIERGEVTADASQAFAIADVLGVSLASLVEQAEALREHWFSLRAHGLPSPLDELDSDDREPPPTAETPPLGREA